jgi:nucleotide-binding universal stress UspA family protein
MIVVGVDGSDGSIRALEWAATEARLRRLPLKLVRAWHPPPDLYVGIGWTNLDGDALGDLRRLAEQRLRETCTERSGVLEGLDVERAVVEGPAASVLVEAAADAELLVVGTRGHGGFAGLLLGSVSAQCAHHSRCPLVIVPPPRSS